MVTNDPAYLKKLYDLVDRYYGAEDFRTLCFALNVDYSSLGGESKSAKVRELILALARTDQLEELVSLAREQRPNVEWPLVPKTIELPRSLADIWPRSQVASQRGSAPSLPALIVGREKDMEVLKRRIGVLEEGVRSVNAPRMIIVRGWPGVGKTTMVAAAAHDSTVNRAFPDGVLWTSLGQSPTLQTELSSWGIALQANEVIRAATLEEASARLAARLRNQRRLLIVDDVWESEHLAPFNVGGEACALLVTTRINSVAQSLGPTPEAVYHLPVLSDQASLELLSQLAPGVAKSHPQEILQLAQELEGLPLALQVAGRLLHQEASYGFGVLKLIESIRDGAQLIEAQAPSDRSDLVSQTTPTVTALLDKSTSVLDELTRSRFALLGSFAPKPATFDLRAMQGVWEVEEETAIKTVRTLVDRGLLEPILETKRFQMHALLVTQARSMLNG